MRDTIRVMFGGDVMLGRLVAEALAEHGLTYSLGPVSGLLRRCDLSIVNLECAITAGHHHWPGARKEFYFGAPIRAATALAEAGIRCVSLANNHSLDFDVSGLRDTLRELDARGIAHAGAGVNLEAALHPAQFELGTVKLAMVAFCDHQADFAAAVSRPGIAFLDMVDEASTLRAWREQLEPLQSRGVHWPILSLHWGPNLAQRPSPHYKRLAHAAIDMGWKIVFGHSAHIFQGVEIYRGRPILYAAGDLLDDYFVDPDFRNDQQLLFELGLSRTALTHVHLHPVIIDVQQVQPAQGKEFDDIAHRIIHLCAEVGTTVHRHGELLALELGSQSASAPGRR